MGSEEKLWQVSAILPILRSLPRQLDPAVHGEHTMEMGSLFPRSQDKPLLQSPLQDVVALRLP